MLLFGLVAAIAWGGADFLAGRASRGAATLSVALWSRGGALVLLLAACWIFGALPAGGALAWSVAAGAGSPFALLFLYRALALGPMSLVAPLTACGAAVPAAVAAALGNLPGPVACAGLVVAFAGAVLVSRPPREPDEPGEAAVVAGGPAGGVATGGGRRREELSRASLLATLGAAVGIGFVLSCLQRAADGASVGTVIGIAMVQASVTVALLAVVAAARGLASRPRRGLGFVMLAGVLDVTANVLFAIGSARANPAAVAVLGALYPVATVGLARVVLGERIGAPQAAGIGLAVAGVALIGAGG